jgi:DNA replication and repair protein RecF
LSSPVALRRVSIRALRNLGAVDLLPGPRLNVIAGDNGHGKTSLLEAIYLVATTRSFRAERTTEVIQTGADRAQIVAQVAEGDALREQRALVAPRIKSFLLDGKRPERLAAYATLTPVVVFHPGDLALVSGAAALRRTLLDRIALFHEPTSGDHRQRYLHALRERQQVLDTRGVSAAELDAYEEVLASEGSHFAAARERAAARLSAALIPAFAGMAPTHQQLDVAYRPAGTTDRESFRATLAQRRPADLRRHAATFGPQRDDLQLLVDGRPARTQASQGQQRVLTLALKLAELATVTEARGAQPILLLDDVSSELDPTRTGAVYDFLRGTAGQVFVTTTRPDLFVTPGLTPSDRVDWRLTGGVLQG